MKTATKGKKKGFVMNVQGYKVFVDNSECKGKLYINGKEYK